MKIRDEFLIQVARKAVFRSSNYASGSPERVKKRGGLINKGL